jgi:hypothetical protein
MNLRVAFYVGHAIAENRKSQTKGWVGMCIFSHYDPKFEEQALRSLRTLTVTFPTKVKALYSFKLSSGSASGLPSGFQDEVFSKIPTHVHEVASQEDLVASMAAHGLTSLTHSGLPLVHVGALTSVNTMGGRLELPGVCNKSNKSSSPATATSTSQLFPPGAQSCNPEEGNHVIPSKHYKMMDKALELMTQADKTMYKDALQGAPEEVWKTEINRDWFLRVENLNCSMAAERLIRYWKLRTNTFGKKKYFALDQTGGGALERKVLATLGTGFINILPNDGEGCPVIFIDSMRLRQKDSKESIHRCLFYMFSLLAEHVQSQTGGVTLLYYLRDADPLILTFLKRLADTLPIRFKIVHLLSLCSLPLHLTSQITFAREVCVHVAGTMALLGAALQARGFEQANLPKRIGGEWGYDKFVHWQELRIRFEWKIPAGQSGRSGLGIGFNFSDIQPYSALTEEEKIERDRRMNVIHSRRKRDRERVEIDALEEEYMVQREKQKKLRRENEELEGLYRKAMALFRGNSFSTSHW